MEGQLELGLGLCSLILVPIEKLQGFGVEIKPNPFAQVALIDDSKILGFEIREPLAEHAHLSDAREVIGCLWRQLVSIVGRDIVRRRIRAGFNVIVLLGSSRGLFAQGSLEPSHVPVKDVLALP